MKSNPSVYNPKNEHYKNKMYRDRLWLDSGESIHRDGNFFLLIFFEMLCVFECDIDRKQRLRYKEKNFRMLKKSLKYTHT